VQCRVRDAYTPAIQTNASGTSRLAASAIGRARCTCGQDAAQIALSLKAGLANKKVALVIRFPDCLDSPVPVVPARLARIEPGR